MSWSKNDDASYLATVGTLLYGRRWQRPLARRMGDTSQATLSLIALGQRQPSEAVQKSLTETIKKEINRLRSTADKLEKLTKDA